MSMHGGGGDGEQVAHRRDHAGDLDRVGEERRAAARLRGRGEMNRSAAFCSSVEKAKEVISTAVTDLARTGRKAT